MSQGPDGPELYGLYMPQPAFQVVIEKHFRVWTSVRNELLFEPWDTPGDENLWDDFLEDFDA